VGNEVVAGLADPWINRSMVAEKVRRPLVGLAAHEAIEVLKAHPARPLVERPRRAVHERRRIMVLTEPRGSIAIITQDSADGRVLWPNDRIIARVAGSHLADLAEADRMMVAPRNNCRPRRRTQRGRMKLRVAQTVLRHAIQGWSGNHAAKGARYTVAGVISHDEKDVRRFLGRHDRRRPPRLRVLGVLFDHSAELGRRRRQLIARDSGRGAGRAGFAGSLNLLRLD